MKILFINHNGGSIYHGPNLRTYYAGKELVKKGHQITIASSSYSHKYGVLPKTTGVVTPERIDGIEFRWIKCIKYKGLLTRIFSHFEYGFKLLFNRRKLGSNFDLVIFSGPPPEIFIFAWLLSKLYGVPVMSDIRDHWPLTQIEMNKLQVLNPYVHFLYLCQFLIIKGSRELISPLPGSDLYLSNKGAKKPVAIIENGFDTSRVFDKEPLQLQIKAKSHPLNLNRSDEVTTLDIKQLNKFVVGYSGGFDRDNDLDSLIKAAKQLADKKDILFLFVGAGIRLEKLISAATALPNILVLDRVASKDVPKVLDIMDICYCGLKPKNIYKYGVSLAKSYEYMAMSKPIIWSIEAYNNPVKESGGGFVTMPGDAASLANIIEDCSKMNPEDLRVIGDKGLKYLQKNFSYDVLGEKWNDLVTKSSFEERDCAKTICQ